MPRLTERPCDFCGDAAEFDGRTVYGPWAYMCAYHFNKVGTGLGVGSGQPLPIK